MATQAIGRRTQRRILAELAMPLIVVLVALQALASLLLMQRRLAGALVDPGPVTLLPAGLLAVALAAAPRFLVRAGRWFPVSAPFAQCVWLLPALGLLLALLALSVSTSALWAVAIIWIAGLAEEFWSWTLLVRDGAIHRPSVPGLSMGRNPPWSIRLRRNPRANAPAPRHETSHLPSDTAENPSQTGDASEPMEAHVWQQTSRAYEVDGADVLHGSLRAFLAVGQRTAHVHLAFCPPFARMPQVDFRQIDGPAARVKLGQLLPYGVRFDVKLDEVTDAPANVLLQLIARGEPIGAPAAQYSSNQLSRGAPRKRGG